MVLVIQIFSTKKKVTAPATFFNKFYFLAEQFFFHVGTENGEEQLKKYPVGSPDNSYVNIF